MQTQIKNKKLHSELLVFLVETNRLGDVSGTLEAFRTKPRFCRRKSIIYNLASKARGIVRACWENNNAKQKSKLNELALFGGDE